MSVCNECIYNKTCNIDCAAIRFVDNIKNEIQDSNKNEWLQEIRSQLDLFDAEPDEGIRELAEKIIKKMGDLHTIRDYNIKIGYVRSYERKRNAKGVVYADCRKVSEVYKAYLPFDYIITVYDRNIDVLNDNQIKILLWHELKHIMMGEKGLTIRPHDIEDFAIILDKYGIEWNAYNHEVPDILEE